MVLQRSIDELRVEVHSLRADLTRSRPSRAHLLPVIAAAVEGRNFTSAEIIRHAEVDSKLAMALDTAEIENARGLGKFLRSTEGRTIGGVRVEQIGEEDEGLIWRAEFQS